VSCLFVFFFTCLNRFCVFCAFFGICVTFSKSSTVAFRIFGGCWLVVAVVFSASVSCGLVSAVSWLFAVMLFLGSNR
jgi:hypothetical protein